MINDESVVLFPEHRNMSLITGTFAFERQTNFQNYLKELGVPYVLRTLAGIARPVVTISRDSQVQYTKIKSSCTAKTKICNHSPYFQSANDQAANTEDDCVWKIKTDTLFKSHTLRCRF